MRILYPSYRSGYRIFPAWNQFQFQLFLFHNPIHFIAKKNIDVHVLCIGKVIFKKSHNLH